MKRDKVKTGKGQKHVADERNGGNGYSEVNEAKAWLDLWLG